MNIPSEQTLARWAKKIKQSDRTSFDQLFRALYPLLTRFAMRYVHDEAAAKDVVQDCFATLWRKRQRLDPEKSVKNFLYTMVRNRALNMLRDQSATDVSHELASLTSASEPEGVRDEDVEGKTLHHQMQKWIAELPKRQKEAFELSRFEGLDHSEIADVMKVSPKTVNNHIVHALTTLRERYEQFNKQDSRL